MTPSLMLRLAALWNFIGTGGALFFVDLHFTTFYAVDVPQTAGVMLVHRTLWLIVGVLGLCYGIAASSLRYRDGILLVGTIGKTMVFVVWTVAVVQGVGTPLMFAGGAGDLVWAGYFVWLLRRPRRGHIL